MHDFLLVVFLVIVIVNVTWLAVNVPEFIIWILDWAIDTYRKRH